MDKLVKIFNPRLFIDGKSSIMGNIRLIKVNAAILALIYFIGALVNWSFNPISWGWLSKIAMIFWLCSDVYYVYNNFAHSEFSLKVSHILFGSIVIGAIFYAVASFISWSFNFLNWNVVSIFIIVLSTLPIFSFIKYVIKKSSSELYEDSYNKPVIDGTKSLNVVDKHQNGISKSSKQYDNELKNYLIELSDESKGYKKEQELNERLANAKDAYEWTTIMDNFDDRQRIDKIESDFWNKHGDEVEYYQEWLSTHFDLDYDLDESNTTNNLDYRTYTFYPKTTLMKEFYGNRGLNYNELVTIVIAEQGCSKEEAEKFLSNQLS